MWGFRGVQGSIFQGFHRSKGFRVSRDRGSPYWQGLSMNWRFQNPKGFRKMYIHVRASNIGVSKSKGFQGKHIHFQWIGVSKNPKGVRKLYLHVRASNIGVSKIQRVQGKHIHFQWIGVSKSKGFQGKYIHKYDLDQNIIVRAWCNHFETFEPFMGN